MTTLVPPGTFHEVDLSQGTVRYLDIGTGPTLVFVHGLLASSLLWRKVIPQLAGHFRCLAPDLPLGAHSLPLRPDADVSPLGVARLVADFMEALDVHNITLVGNDTGGAICQLVIAHHSERIARLVLTNCDAFESFFPLSLRPFQYGAHLFGTRFADFLAWLLRSRFVQRQLWASVSLSQIDPILLDAGFSTMLQQAGVRRDVTRFLRAVSNRYTLEAAQTFPQFQRPVLLIWGKDDIFFSSRLAQRLYQAFPSATLEFLSQSRAFVPEDQPEALARRIAEFVRVSIET